MTDERRENEFTPVWDDNLERLLRQAYRPERVDEEFAQRTEAAMLAAARERAAARRVDGVHSGVRVAWLVAMAAAAVLAFWLGGLLSAERVQHDGEVVWIDGRPYERVAEPVGEALPLQPVVPGEQAPAPAEVAGGLRPRARKAAPTVERLVAGASVRTEAGQRRRAVLPDGSVLYVNEDTDVRVGARRLNLVRGELFVEVAPALERFVVDTAAGVVTGQGTKFGVRQAGAGTEVLVTQGEVEVAGDTRVRAGQQLAFGDAAPSAAPRASHAFGWTRDLMAAAESPLVPASEYGGGALVAVDPYGQEMRLSLRKLHVDVHIEDGFARTTIDQTYFNHTMGRLEGTFYFPLPPDASLSRLAMYVNGKLMEGGMAERGHARNVYEQIVHRQQDPALLEWVDGSTFKMRVFPLEPRREKRVVLSYTQKLSAAYGETRYRFAAGHNLGVVRDWSFRARLRGRAGAPWDCRTHELEARTDGADLVLAGEASGVIPDTDVVVTLYLPEPEDGEAARDTRFATVLHEGERYLMVGVRPELPAAQGRARRDWIFLFEASGDRDPVVARVQVDVIKSLLQNAEGGDTFSILTAGTRVQAYAAEPRPCTRAEIDAALAFLDRTHLVGALDLGQALRATASFVEAAADPYLVHLGSGVPVVGEREVDALLEEVPAGATYVGVGVGKRWQRTFMKAAAARSGGFVTQINPDEQVGWRAFELKATLDAPRLLDVRVTGLPDEQSFLAFDDAAVQGDEIVAVARLEKGAALPRSVLITGRLGGQAWQREVAVPELRAMPASAGYLPRSWAKLEIERLVTAGAEANKDAIVKLSMAMYVMSPFTSLLVLEDEAMYAQFGVDRGRKDHWALYPCPEEIEDRYEAPGAAATPTVGAGGRAPREAVLKSIIVRGDAPLFVDPATQWSYSEGLTAWQMDMGGAAPEEYWFTTTLSAETRQRIPIPVAVGAIRAFSAGDGVQRTGGLDVLGGNLNLGQPIFSGSEFRFTNTFADELKLGFDLPFPPYSAFVPSTETGTGSFFMGTGRRSSLSLADIPTKLPWVARHFAAPDEDEVPSYWLRDLAAPPDLLYRRPAISASAPLFGDLLVYAPAMNTSVADIAATLEREARPDAALAAGRMDDAARQLIEAARARGWEKVMVPGGARSPSFDVVFDGTGRYVYERTTETGLREQVTCDGSTLTHLYPELGVGAKRLMGRAHRAALRQLVPWALSSPADLACGADVLAIDDHTVALVPSGAQPADRRLHLVFAADGRLAERQLVRGAPATVVLREIYGEDGQVQWRGTEDGTEKVQLELRFARGSASEPSLRVDARDLVVLPMPLRTREHVLQQVAGAGAGFDPNTDSLAAWTEDEALALIGADLAGRGAEIMQIAAERFMAHGDQRVGFYTLIAAGRQLWSMHEDLSLMRVSPRTYDPLAEHPDSPVARYVGWYLASFCDSRSAGDVDTGPLGVSLFADLAEFRWLQTLWSSGGFGGLGGTERQSAIDRAIEFVRSCSVPALAQAAAWIVMPHLTGDDNRRALAEAQLAMTEDPALGYVARYERARLLRQLDRKDEARQVFAALHEEALAAGELPRVDADFQRAFDKDWGAVMRAAAERLGRDGRLVDVVLLAWQCHQLGDAALADEILTSTAKWSGDDRSQLASLAGVLYLWHTGQHARASAWLEPLLEDEALGAQPAVLRLAARVAEQDGKLAVALRRQEAALDAEYRDLPEVIDLQAVRQDYGGLLAQYEQLAKAITTLQTEAPAAFAARVVRAADRWRSLDSDPTQACQAASRVLQLLGLEDLAWDYLTTPLAAKPNEAAPWLAMAGELQGRGDYELADRAYAQAFAAESTNAQVLWDRAQNLLQVGRQEEARGVLRQLANGEWQPRFAGVQERARSYVGGR